MLNSIFRLLPIFLSELIGIKNIFFTQYLALKIGLFGNEVEIGVRPTYFQCRISDKKRFLIFLNLDRKMSINRKILFSVRA